MFYFKGLKAGKLLDGSEGDSSEGEDSCQNVSKEFKQNCGCARMRVFYCG